MKNETLLHNSVYMYMYIIHMYIIHMYTVCMNGHKVGSNLAFTNILLHNNFSISGNDYLCMYFLSYM